MELSQEKTLITHSNTPARFLGFDVRVRRDASVKRSGKRKMRTMNNKVELNIPLKDKVETYLLSHSIADSYSSPHSAEPHGFGNRNDL